MAAFAAIFLWELLDAFFDYVCVLQNNNYLIFNIFEHSTTLSCSIIVQTFP